ARCVFPSPDDDMLLCLSLTGGPGFQPLKKPLHKMMETPANRHRMYYTNVNVKTNDGMALEALVSAAMVLASHKGGVGDVAFPAFLGALLFQLGVTRTDEPTALPVVLNKKSGTGTANITVPFLSAPNVEWPLLAKPGYSLGNFYRTDSKDCIDFRIESDVIPGLQRRTDDRHHQGHPGAHSYDPSAHIVVTRTLEDSSFNEEELLEWNGLEHTEFYRVLGPQRFERVSTLRNQAKKRQVHAMNESENRVRRRVDRVILFIEVSCDVWERAFLMPLKMNGSRRRVFPLAEIQTTDVVTGSSSSWLLPPKSPLHGATRPTSRASSSPPASSFDRMLMLRNMNVATLTEPSSLIATESEDSPSAESTISSNAESEDTVPIEPIKPVVESEPEPTAPPPIVETVTLSTLATTPFAQVLSVHAGSPAAHAGLCADDLLLQFGGITSDSPKCLLAIAELVQSHVNQAIPIEVLRAVTSNPTDDALSCNSHHGNGRGKDCWDLSPFKWPPEAPESPPKPMDQPETTQEQHVELLVIHNVLNDSLAHRLGLQDGDMLSKCGDLSTPQELTDLPTVSAYIQTHWRAAKNALPFELHRWMPQEQSYTVVSVVIPSPEDSEASLGCSLTSYKDATYDADTGADLYGDSPLHAAAASGATDVAVLLLESRFIRDVNLVNHAQLTPAHMAVDVNVLTALSDRFQADLVLIDNDGRMPLLYACLRQDVASVKFLCARQPELVDYADAHGDTALHLAAWHGFLDVVQALLPYLPSIALYTPNADGQTAYDLAQDDGVRQLLSESMALGRA
ncbi:TPA: LOW QUALITY PROTEIN: hypothetical protein N0F65_006776, partial [Lagenidium giganteum]